MDCTPFLPGVQTSTEYCLLASSIPTRVVNVAKSDVPSAPPLSGGGATIISHCARLAEIGTLAA
jgi:hypothetical protein